MLEQFALAIVLCQSIFLCSSRLYVFSLLQQISFKISLLDLNLNLSNHDVITVITVCHRSITKHDSGTSQL